IADLSDPAPSGVFGPEVERLARLGILDDEAKLIAHIDATMEATGYSTNASRGPADIARRLREKRELASTRLDSRTLALLKEFLTLELSLADAPQALAAFAEKARLSLGAALERFDARVTGLREAGVDPATIIYRAAFGRPLDYYTGL